MGLARASALLTVVLGLAGCAAQNGLVPTTIGGPPSGPQALGATESTTTLPMPAGGRIALLAPLTGSYAQMGPEIVNAVKLGLGAGAASLDVLDTGSTPQGAAAAAQKAIQDGAGLIIGPLTYQEASAIGGITGPAHVDVLSLTSDSSVARPGLWALGITPREQVQALVAAANAQGHGQVAGFLSDSPLGSAMMQALQSADPGAQIATYTAGSFGAMNTTLRSFSGYAGRRGEIDAKLKSLKGAHTVAARSEAARLARTPIPPPPFNALMIDTTGSHLAELATLLPYYDVNPGPVLILGPGLWASDPGAVANAGFRGALYAAPDPQAATSFNASYAAAYGAPPSPLAAIAFDAAALARVASAQGRIDQSVITNPSGFTGADGLLALGPDGSVRRGLAVFQVQAGGAQIVQPAARSFAPGS